MSKVQYFAIFAAIALVVLLFFAPNKPPLKKKVEIAEENKSADEKLAVAISFVEQGADPMKGIMMLREILQEDSNHLKANFYLGKFSMQSNQWEKAKMRFEKVIQLDSANSEAYLHLSTIHKNFGDTINANQYLIKYNQYKNNQIKTQ